MSREFQIVSSGGVPAGIIDASSSGGPSQMQDEQQRRAGVLKRMHELLRGRYWLVIVLTAILGAAGWGAAYWYSRDVYRSKGTIQLSAVIPVVLQKSPESDLSSRFSSYMESQLMLMQSERVIRMAVDDPDWRRVEESRPKSGKKTAKPTTQSGSADTGDTDRVRSFQGSLSVARVSRESELVNVTFDDLDAKASTVAVNVTIKAYEKIFREVESQARNAPRQALEDKRDQLSAQIKELRQRMVTIAEAYGSTDLDTIYRTKLDELSRLEKDYRDSQLAASSAEDALKRGEDVTGIAGLTAEEIATTDARMAMLVDRKQAVEHALNAALRRLGEKHAQVQTLREEFTLVEESVRKYVEDYKKKRFVLLVTSRDFNITQVSPALVMQLRTREKRLADLYEQQKAEVTELGKKNLALGTIRNDIEFLTGQHEQIKKRLEELGIEGSVTGRLSIFAWAENPTVPYRSRSTFGLAGMFLGGAIGFGLVLLIATRDQRFRNLRDARDGIGRIRMLGILPRLPENLADPEQAALAAHCVHHIRALLQLGPEESEKKVFSVTSPAAGDGKTSLAVALGMSFATSGCKTLLLDGDMVGGGLTRRLRAITRDRVGMILKQTNVISDSQLQEALKVASNSSKRLGEILVELGYVAQSDVETALAVQVKANLGMLDAVNGVPLDDCILDTTLSNMYALGVGRARSHHVGMLSPVAVRRMLDELRTRFDAIVIDTGPTPGSLEASIFASEVDGVVLVVSHGEQRFLARQAVTHLQAINAHVAGMVFNRAEVWDVEASYYTSRSRLSRRGVTRLHQADDRISIVQVETGEISDPARLGPLAGAVVKHTQPGNRSRRAQEEDAKS